MENPYDEKYDQEKYYWGVRPSAICFEVLKILPPEKPLKLLDIGCGEGHNTRIVAERSARISAIGISGVFIKYPKETEEKEPLGE